MFWFYVILTIVTYPFVLIVSCLGWIIIVILSDVYTTNIPNPFISPASVYRAYKDNITRRTKDLKDWYRKENE